MDWIPDSGNDHFSFTVMKSVSSLSRQQEKRSALFYRPVHVNDPTALEKDVTLADNSSNVK